MTNVHLAFRPKDNHFLILNHYIPKLCLNHSELFGKVLVRVCWWNRNWALRLPLVFLSFICLIFSKCSFHTFLVNTVWHSLILKKKCFFFIIWTIANRNICVTISCCNSILQTIYISKFFWAFSSEKYVLFLTSSS